MMEKKYVETEIARPDGISEEAKGNYGFVNGSRFEYRYDKPIVMSQIALDILKESKRMQRIANAKLKIYEDTDK